MDIVELKAEKREIAGKEISKKLRRDGMVPAVVYSGGKSTPITVNSREFNAMTHSDAGTNVIVKLKMTGARKHPNAIIKEIQHNPITKGYFHIDFQEIDMADRINAMIPVHVVGESAGVKLGGLLEHHTWELEIEGLPGDMPDHLDVDITELQIGDSVHAGDITLPEGMALLSDPETAVLTISTPQAERVEVAAEEEIAPELVEGAGEAAAAEAEE